MHFRIDDKLLEIAKRPGQSRLRLFLSMAVPATLVAISLVTSGEADGDMHDGGKVLIMALIAALCYGAIWLYVHRLFQSKR
jgi:hypothetical protein